MIQVFPPLPLNRFIDSEPSVFGSLTFRIDSNGFGDPGFDPATSITNTSEVHPAHKSGALVMTLNTKPAAPAWTTNHGLVLVRPHNIGDLDEFRITYSAWMSNNLVNAGGGGRAFWSFKTGGVGGNRSVGDFRMGCRIKKMPDGKQRFDIHLDNGANNGLPLETYLRYVDNQIDVPEQTWFKFDVYVNRPLGILTIKYNDTKIFDGEVVSFGDQNLPVTRLFVNSNYTGGDAPQTTKIANLQIFA
jgi:hypothetical protein